MYKLCLKASAHRHVGSTASTASLRLGVDETTADAEVAQFDLTFSIDEDVGGFDVSMDDSMFLFQVQQCFHYLQQEQKQHKYKH